MIYFYYKKLTSRTSRKVRHGRRSGGGGGQCTWSPGSNWSAGVAVLNHPNSAAKLVDSKTDLAGRVVTALIDFHGQRFQIINVYGPNKHRERELFFDNLWRFKYPNIEAIVVGDFNCVPDITLDKWGGDDSFGDRAVTQLHSFTVTLALEDFFSVSNPRGRIFTWFKVARLDFLGGIPPKFERQLRRRE